MKWIKSADLSGKTDGAGLGIRKVYTAAIEIPQNTERTVRFRITTGQVDRERDVINPKGWDLSDYLKSPVIMWSHSYHEPPIGRALNVEQDDKGMSATVEFAPAETYAFADTIFRLVKGGFINATSVGFQPQEWVYNEERRGYDFQKQSLLEVSCCGIPANPGALVEARAAGIDVEPLREWAAKTLEALGDHAPALARAFTASPGSYFLSLPSNTRSVSISGTAWTLSNGTDGWTWDGTGQTEWKSVTAKAKPECPKATACPNMGNDSACPAGAECPMTAEPQVPRATDDTERKTPFVLELLDVSDETAIVLEIAPDPEVPKDLADQAIKDAVLDSVTAMLPDLKAQLALQLRDAMTALTGRLD